MGHVEAFEDGWIQHPHPGGLGPYPAPVTCTPFGPLPTLIWEGPVFDGVTRLVIVYLGRFSEMRRYYFDREFTPMQVGDTSDNQRAGDVVAKPETYELMREAAERIAEGFDYLGVDFYSEGGEVWFSETSPYEGGGGTRFRPASFDEELGSYWTLPPL
ncbi:ATP-grasp fold amidoligase family protein [Kocuria flava]|uniref:ATP-grasp fold amidoligase family protein n=1 Tax=Kocuria flava TaxID=446860 RepID=UPI000C79E772